MACAAKDRGAGRRDRKSGHPGGMSVKVSAGMGHAEIVTKREKFEMIAKIYKKAALLGAAGLLFAAQAASAGTISFLSIANGTGFQDSTNSPRVGGEADWNTRVGAGIGVLDMTTGISVVGSAILSSGGSALAYFDNGAGLGVCSVVTKNGQCNPANDDNVGAIGGSNNAGDGTYETLVLSFSESVLLNSIMFRAEGHGLFTGTVKINGTDTSVANGVFNTPLTGSVFNFQYLPVDRIAGSTNEFYIDSVDISAVPVPAAGVLLMTALGGLAAVRRRKRAA